MNGAVAQLVAHLHGMQGVRGSSPLSSTEDRPPLAAFFCAGRRSSPTPETTRSGLPDAQSTSLA
jgi:hypothetical protein